MEIKPISVDKIKRAEVRYYESAMNGVAIPVVKSYVFLVEVNGTYINVVDPFREYNVWGRAPYTNSTKNGEEYGTKIELINGEIKDGLCYVLDSMLPIEFSIRKDISIDEIYAYMINSEDFYYDRLKLLKKYPKLVKNHLAKKIIASDLEKHKEFLEYLIPDTKVYKKTNNY